MVGIDVVGGRSTESSPDLFSIDRIQLYSEFWGPALIARHIL